MGDSFLFEMSKASPINIDTSKNIDVFLLLNGSLGLNVLNEVLKSPNARVVGILLNSEKKRRREFELEVLEKLPPVSSRPEIYTYSPGIWDSPEIIKLATQVDFGMSALFGHIIPQGFLDLVNTPFFNLHPSLLPYGKGADPIPWGIIENEPLGVSLHEIDSGLDTGPVLYQSVLKIKTSCNAGQIYTAAMSELLNLFRNFMRDWPNLPSPLPVNVGGSMHNSYELNLLRERLVSGDHDFEKFVRTIQALIFSDGRKPLIRMKNGEVWAIDLNMTPVLQEDLNE